MARTAVIVIGGAELDRRVLAALPTPRLVVAADSGFDLAAAIDLHVDLLVGDLDSITPAGRARAERAGVTICRHPVDKDATDTELAIRAAVDHGADHLIGLSGGRRADELRLDHELGALLALADPGLAGHEVEAWWGRAHVDVVHGPGTIEVGGVPGALLSLIPVHGAAIGVTTAGLRYPLTDETLGPGTSRGISNVLIDERASVTLAGGSLLVILPDAVGGA